MNRLSIRLLFAAIFAAVFFSPQASPAANPDDKPTTQTQTFQFPARDTTRIVDNDEVARMVETHGSELLVVNLWATWCGPCLEELPYFERLARETKEGAVQFVGVSVDLKNQVESQVIPFLKKREMPYPSVVFFGDSEEMINFFSTEWKGDIPATFFYNKQGEKVGQFLGQVTYEELKQKVEQLRQSG